MKFIVILSFIVMYFILWCFLRVASIADEEYEKYKNYFVKNKDKIKR